MDGLEKEQHKDVDVIFFWKVEKCSFWIFLENYFLERFRNVYRSEFGLVPLILAKGTVILAIRVYKLESQSIKKKKFKEVKDGSLYYHSDRQ